ncbi:hypothetical protein K440DRAFT_402227 [Wilcoxina mikolae CBS 423.85]|nr:hypothetical protein K440DRAFT_402227 [Wilcoxina mikolae CBS 423.85]
MFRKHPGHQKVIQRGYEIEGPEGGPIEESEWEEKVLLPGVRIAMNILVRKLSMLRSSQTPAEMSSRKCPKCDILTPKSAVIKGSIRCADCNLVFRITDTERMIEEVDSLTNINSSSGETQVESSSHRLPKFVPATKLQEGEIREEVVFQRIHYIREFLKFQSTSTPANEQRELEEQRLPSPLTPATPARLLTPRKGKIVIRRFNCTGRSLE